MKDSERPLFIAFSSASFFIVGVGIVLPAWVAFHEGGSGLVGLVLLSTSVAGLLLAPVAGHLADRHDRAQVTVAGQTIRALGLAVLAPVGFLTESLSPVLLIASGVLGAFGFALLSGSLSGILQAIVPEAQRMGFALRLSLFNQLGIAIGTGATGLAIDRLGSLTTALMFAAAALACLPLLKPITAQARDVRSSRRLSLLSASRQALSYLLASPQALSAAVTVGLAFAVIQITNLLLPGFVIRSLDGDSGLFGLLEMAAAITGMVALAVVGFPSIAKRLQGLTPAILAIAGVSLFLFSLAPNRAIAIVLYCVAGMLWKVSRAAANGHLLTVVDAGMIGRVQAFTALLTGGFGLAIYLIPTIAPGASEATLYMACGAAIVACVGGLSLWTAGQERSRKS
ncbi:MFS transporter [Bradyrhizobium sp. CW7]|uniref:MFS transporter n=1 Tax=unclassified Bradyrhizobium TaxID=2631580 RepID=UPI00036D8E22|nr:MFS transporter [Bradyrhizobium sp. WSM4349]MCK1357179.1 MFS transporter [Bradyrhizobium sp. CW7]MCK1710589.1 MFS transporter [Bradyrhizobium sp. 143]